MDVALFERLHGEGLVSDGELDMVRQKEAARTESLQWDLRTLLYAGIIMLSAGLGVFIYKNLDSIGHVTVLAAVGLLCAGTFVYCFKFARPFSRYKVEPPNLWFDYILLLGCLLMVIFLGYLQFQFHLFGSQWGLATFIPMVLLFASAYYFDHKGVLTMAITALGAWMGIALEPAQLLRLQRMNNDDMVWNGVVLGLLLHLATLITETRQFKEHFAPVYKNFGVHLLFIALLAGSFINFDWFLPWCLAVGVVAAFHFYESVKNKSFYYFVVTALYSYVAISYVVMRGIISMDNLNEGAIYFAFLYFIGSGIGVASLLITWNKKLKQ